MPNIPENQLRNNAFNFLNTLGIFGEAHQIDKMLTYTLTTKAYTVMPATACFLSVFGLVEATILIFS